MENDMNFTKHFLDLASGHKYRNYVMTKGTVDNNDCYVICYESEPGSGVLVPLFTSVNGKEVKDEFGTVLQFAQRKDNQGGDNA